VNPTSVDYIAVRKPANRECPEGVDVTVIHDFRIVEKAKGLK
jgi:hypothetical protein